MSIINKILYKSWSELKTLLESKDLRLQYDQTNFYYYIFIIDTEIEYFTQLWIDTTKVEGIDISQNDIDLQDFIDNYKATANQSMSEIHRADVIVSGGKNRLAVDATVNVAVEDFYGFDNNASTYFLITNAEDIGDTINIQIDSPPIVNVTAILTASEAGNIEATAILVKNNLNADSDFKTKFLAKVLHNKIYIISYDVGEKGEYPNTTPDDFRVITTGMTTVNIPFDFNRIIRREKLIIGEPDPKDNRFVRLGIFGDIGAITKANNPINLSIRKNLATKTLTIFVDQDIPSSQIWYILGCAVADDLAAEFNLWEGIERNREENYVGDGTTAIFALDYAIMDNAGYIIVKIDAVVQTFGTDYDILVSEDGTTGTVIFNSAPANNSNIEVIYAAVIRRCAAFVQGDSSYTYKFEAPVKLSEGQFFIGTVSNKSANAGIVCMNISGFFESTEVN